MIEWRSIIIIYYEFHPHKPVETFQMCMSNTIIPIHILWVLSVSLEMSLSLIKVLLVPEFEWCFVDWVWFLYILLVLSTMWGLVTPISWYYVYHAVLLRLASLISCFEFYDFPPRNNCRVFSNSIIIQVGGLYIVYN